MELVEAAGPAEMIVNKSSRTIWVHRLKIERLEALDDELGAWLAASWAAYAKPAADRQTGSA